MHTAHPSPIGMAIEQLASHLQRLLAGRRRVTDRPVADPAAASPCNLHQGETLVAAHPRGLCLQCLAGSLWITHDGDCKDLILESGETYQPAHDRRMLVYALAPASVLMAHGTP
jgi:hypothetical protein